MLRKRVERKSIHITVDLVSLWQQQKWPHIKIQEGKKARETIRI